MINNTDSKVKIFKSQRKKDSKALIVFCDDTTKKHNDFIADIKDAEDVKDVVLHQDGYFVVFGSEEQIAKVKEGNQMKIAPLDKLIKLTNINQTEISIKQAHSLKNIDVKFIRVFPSKEIAFICCTKQEDAKQLIQSKYFEFVNQNPGQSNKSFPKKDTTPTTPKNDNNRQSGTNQQVDKKTRAEKLKNNQSTEPTPKNRNNKKQENNNNNNQSTDKNKKNEKQDNNNNNNQSTPKK